MNETERREWLSNLKEEDKVANEHYNSWRGGSYYQIYTVKKIIPTGKIRLNNGVLLNSNGRYYPRDVWNSNSYDIEPVTDEILEAIRIRKLKIKLNDKISKIFNDYNLMGMSVEDLETINNILEKYINKEDE